MSDLFQKFVALQTVDKVVLVSLGVCALSALYVVSQWVTFAFLPYSEPKKESKNGR